MRIDLKKIAELIGPSEVVVSSELADRIRRQGGYTAVYSRKILQRHYSEVGFWRSEKLLLERDMRLYARRKFVGTYAFLGRVSAALANTTRQGMARCLAVLEKEEVLLHARAQKLLAAPTISNRAGPSYSEECEALQELGVTLHRGSWGFDFFVAASRVLTETTEELAHKAAARQRVEVMLTRMLTNHYREQNLVESRRSNQATPEEGFVEYNDQIFSAFGFTFLNPFVHWTGKSQKPCSVVFDVHTGRCEDIDVRSFHQRMERASHRGDSRIPILGVIGAREFSAEAWKTARAHRMATVNFRQLFGDTTIEALKQTELILADLDAARTDTGYLAELLDDLKGNPIVTHLRSIAFEVLAALAIRADGWESVGLNLDVPFSSAEGETTRDVDVYGVKGDEARVVECKAYHSAKEVTSEEVRKFFTETIPAYVNEHRRRGFQIKKCRAEIWTTGRFGEDAVTSLKALKLGVHVEPVLCTTTDIKGMLSSKLGPRCADLLKEIGRHHARKG